MSAAWHVQAARGDETVERYRFTPFYIIHSCDTLDHDWADYRCCIANRTPCNPAD